MRNYLIMMSMLLLSSCNEVFHVQNSINASDICSGKAILNVAGTADCSGPDGSSSGPILMLSFASRKDNSSFPMTAMDFATFFSAPDRVVASLQDEAEENTTFTDNHSVIPNPLEDSDGRYQMVDYTFNPVATTKIKKHYLETIAVNGPITMRSNIVACGSSGTIESRIADCATLNGLWSFYDGKKYGQDGEGDWKLVSVITAPSTYEVWRDERTKLLWSDQSSATYNWYQAAGYSKSDIDSLAESEFLSSPGTMDPQIGQVMQPINPLSVCPDVVAGEIAAGDGTYANYDPSPEPNFKAGLTYPQATWRLPSMNDWRLAEINGIRKVLPNMDATYWLSSSYSGVRFYAWMFYGSDGSTAYDNRSNSYYVRCVASSRD